MKFRFVLPPPLLALDAWVLGRCTRVAHAVQRLTGRTNFFLAKLGLGVAAMGEVAEMVDRHRMTGEMVLGGFILLSLFLSSLDCDRADRRAHTSAERAVDAAFRHVRRPGWRLVMLGMALSDFVATLLWLGRPTDAHPLRWLVYWAGMTAYYYFGSVDPLPPQRSMIRVWVQQLRAGLSAVGASPEPARVPE